MEVKLVPWKKWLKGYFALLKEVYRGDPNFVFPLRVERKEFLNPDKNPFFKHADVEFYIAKDKEKPLGTIVAFVDHMYNDYHRERVCHFGFFECIKDERVAEALFQRVEAFAVSKKLDVIRGPFNFSTNHECGLLVDGFDSPPVILMTYNPPYYRTYIENSGYTKAMDLLAYRIDRKPVPEGLEMVCENIKKTYPVTVDKLRKKEFDVLVKLVMEIYTDAWSENWGFAPLTEEEFRFIAWGLKYFLDEDISFMVRLDGKPIGFSITLPDYNVPLRRMKGRLFPFGIIHFLRLRKKIKNARIFALGIKKEHHDKGFGALLYMETWKALLNKGYQWAEMSWILENNYRMRRAIEMAGAVVYKTYRIYEKKVNL